MDGVQGGLETLFLPTPSARRATPFTVRQLIHFLSISTHALREEGDGNILIDVSGRLISTHALREEGDTSATSGTNDLSDISTHALREEGDSR